MHESAVIFVMGHLAIKIDGTVSVEFPQIKWK
jgi:hypothetical protein